MEEIVTNGDKIYADGFITLQPKLRKEKKYNTFWKMGYTPAHYVLYCHPLKRTRDKIKNLPIKEETKGERTCTEE